MASSPSKRRRTYLGTSIHINTINTDIGLQSEHASQPVSSRPSFMSPTKASLARFHPNLTSSSESSSAPRSKGKQLLEKRSHALNIAQGNSCPAPDRISSTLESPAGLAGQEPRASPPAEAVDVDTNGNLPAFQSVDGESLASLSGDKLINSSRELHDKAGELDDDTMLPSTPAKSRSSQADVPEPRLPSTPRQLGLEPPASRSANGLSDSPIKRTKRKWPSSAKSSPLKPKNKFSQPQVIQTQSGSMLGPRSSDTPYLSNRWYVHPGVSLVIDGTPDHAAAFGSKCKAVNAREDSPSEETPTQSFTNFPCTSTKSPSELAAVDPPYALQAECGLEISASDEIRLNTVNSPNVMSRDVICRSKNSLLEAKIRLYLKSNSTKVASVDVVQLSPWAFSELGAWLKAPIADRNQDSIVKAISCYWNMAEIRAFCWHQCKQDTAHSTVNLEDGLGSSREELGDLGAKPEISKTSVIESAQGINDEGQDHPLKPKENHMKTGIHFLGHKALLFTDNTVSLQVSWDIQFMPSGEVTSIVSTNPGFPKNWADGPELSDLPRVSEAFVRLVKSGKSVYEAIRRITENVFPP